MLRRTIRQIRFLISFPLIPISKPFEPHAPITSSPHLFSPLPFPCSNSFLPLLFFPSDRTFLSLTLPLTFSRRTLTFSRDAPTFSRAAFTFSRGTLTFSSPFLYYSLLSHTSLFPLTPSRKANFIPSLPLNHFPNAPSAPTAT